MAAHIERVKPWLHRCNNLMQSCCVKMLRPFGQLVVLCCIVLHCDEFDSAVFENLYNIFVLQSTRRPVRMT